MGSLFIGEFKTEEQKLRCRKGKCGHSSVQLPRIPRAFKTETSWVDQPGSLPSCLGRSCVIQVAIRLFEMDVFEMDVFEMDVLVIKGSMSGTCIIIKKAPCQVLTLLRLNMRKQVSTKMQT